MQGQQGRSSVGCVLLVGLILFGVGSFLALVSVGGRAGLLRDDPQGLLLLGAAVTLVGVLVVFFAISMRRR